MEKEPRAAWPRGPDMPVMARGAMSACAYVPALEEGRPWEGGEGG